MKIPRYKSNRQLTGTNNTSGIKPDLSISRGIQASGEKMIKQAEQRKKKEDALAAKMKQMTTETETLNATNEYNRKLNDLKLQAEQTTDENEVTRLQDELLVASSNSASMIGDENARNTWSLKNEGDRINDNYKFQHDLYGRQASEYNTTLNGFLGSSLDAAVNDPRYNGAQADDVQARLASGVEKGFLDKEESEQKMQKWLDDYKNRSIDLSIKQNPAEALERLSNTDLGLNDEELATKKSEAHAEMKKQDKMQIYVGQKVQVENALQVGSLIADNPMAFTPAEIDSMDLTPSTKTQYKKMIKQNPVVLRDVEWRIVQLNEEAEKLFTGEEEGGVKGGFLNLSKEDNLKKASKWLEGVNNLSANGWMTSSKRQDMVDMIGTSMSDLPAVAKYFEGYGAVKQAAIEADPINWETIVAQSLDKLVDSATTNTMEDTVNDIKVNIMLGANSDMTKDAAKQKINEKAQANKQATIVSSKGTLQDGKLVFSA